MPYVTRYERIMREEGREEGRGEGAILIARQIVGETLETKFGEGSVGLKAKVEGLTDVAQIRKIIASIIAGATLDDLDKLIP